MEVELYGTVPTERDSGNAIYQKVMPVSFEIEASWELDHLEKMDILENLGISYSLWVEHCYKGRMKQSLMDPLVK